MTEKDEMNPFDPSAPQPDNSWVGTNTDPVWLRFSARIAELRDVSSVQHAAHECQIAVAHLSMFAQENNPTGRIAQRALSGLVMDVHQELRSIGVGDHAEEPRSARRSDGFVRWLRSPVGSGRTRSQHFARLTTLYHFTAITRAVGAVVAAFLTAIGLVDWALLALLVSAAISGAIRFRTNAETTVTFRARFISFMLGQLGDATVLAACTWQLVVTPSLKWLAGPTLVTVFTMSFGSLMRAGALQIGVHVRRLRLERVFRYAGLCAILSGLALGTAGPVILALILIGGYGLFDVIRTTIEVWAHDATEFAWTVRRVDGFDSQVVSAPSPTRSDDYSDSSQ